jgi:hypothetical protein
MMAQIEHPDTLAQWTNPAHRLVTIILIRCGLRVTDALRLPADCLVTDSDAAPYLRYDNHKMKRQALVPIDEDVQALTITERARTAASPWLFPRATKNPDGQHPTDSSTYTGSRSTAGSSSARSAMRTAGRSISPRTSGATRSEPA